LTLLTIGVGCLVIADRAWKSVTGYQTPYAIEADLPAGEPLTERLMLIVLDGVRVDAARDMPHLQKLAARGSSGIVTVGMPSLSNPGRATMATGAWPEVHGVTNNGGYRPPPMDSIFSLAKREGVPRTAYGSDLWNRAFGDHLDPNAVFTFDKDLHVGEGAEPLAERQREVCVDMAAQLVRFPTGLIVVGITATDTVGHDFGGESEEYLQLVAEADSCIAQLDDERTTFVVTSDHGHIHRRGQGGHGGAEPEVVQVPLVFAGPGVSRSSGWTGEQVDIAPTICALLGLPLPANSQGRVITEAVAASIELQARIDEQRKLVEEQGPNRYHAMGAGQEGRAVFSALVALGLVLIAGSFVLTSGPRLILAAVLWSALYAAMFWAFGLGYSLSAVVREEYLNSFFLRNLCGAVVGIVAVARVFRNRLDAFPIGFFVACLLGLRVIWIHWQHGLMMRELMPDLAWAFTAYLDLLAIFGVGLGTAVSLLGAHFCARTASR